MDSPKKTLSTSINKIEIKNDLKTEEGVSITVVNNKIKDCSVRNVQEQCSFTV